MLAELGFFLLLLSLLTALYAVAAAIYAARTHNANWLESARLAAIITWPLLWAACFTLIWLLSTGAFEVAYVASTSSTTMPWYLKVTALWGGQEGSLLFWSATMATFAGWVQLRNWERERDLQPWVIAVSMVTLLFFIGITLVFENPFRSVYFLPNGQPVTTMFAPAGAQLFTPADGRGLNPLLRHPGMVIHPPLLYLGFVGFVVPFAFAIAALVVGRTDDAWMRITRRWTIVAWLFLSLGLILGGRWAYDVLGWGGYWGWDPVEIAAFMPWLTGTAFLHSVMIQEKRGMFKRWNMVLIMVTYSLVIFGTFLTRSGVLSSVHSFAQSAIGPSFFTFIAITLVGSTALLIWRWDALHNEHHLDSWLSREGLFLINNLLFMGITVACFWGVIYPLVSEVVVGTKVTVGPPYYEQTTGPMFAGLLLLMGIAPLAAWRQTTVKSLGKSLWKPTLVALIALVAWVVLGRVTNTFAIIGLALALFVGFVTLYEFWRGVVARRKHSAENYAVALWHLMMRNRRRYGGYIIHLGVVFMAIGIIGNELFQIETQRTMRYGDILTIDRYDMVYRELIDFPTTDGRIVTRATVDVYENNRQIATLYPRRDFYLDSGQPMTIPGARSTIQDDFYVLLVGWDQSTASATFKVYVNPLVNWLWFGGVIFILGTLVATWPDPQPTQVPVSVAGRTRERTRKPAGVRA